MTAGSAIAPRPQAAAPSPGETPGQSAPSAGQPHRQRKPLTLLNKASTLALTLLALTLIPAHHASAQIYEFENPSLTYTITEDASPNTVTNARALQLGFAGSVQLGVFTEEDSTGMYGTFVLRQATGRTRAALFTYTLDNDNTDVNGLDDGETLTETFTVNANQTSGPAPQLGAQSATITINIQGSTDPTRIVPSIFNPDALTGEVLEDGSSSELRDSAQVVVTRGAVTNLLLVEVTEMPTTYGTFTTSVGAANLWFYTLDNTNPAVDALNDGETLTDTFTLTAADDGDTPATAVVTITIRGATDSDRTPTFGTATIAPQTYAAGTAVSVTLPTATDGNGTLSYAITETLPDGLTFTPATRVLDGTPTTGQAATTYTYTVTDADANQAATDADTLSFTIAITDLMPTFGTATIADQTYLPETAITDLTLPEATGGDGTLTYTLTPTPPTGLTFDDTTRVLSGTTPTTEQRAVPYTYTATDSDADPARLTFTITIADDPPVIVFAGGSRMTVDEGAMVTLDGSGSSDPEGQAVTFLWTVDATNEVPVTLSDTTAAAPTFTAPEERTRLTFTLTVSDNSTPPNSAAATLTVQVGRSQFDNVHRTILPEVTRAMMDTTVSAIARRTEQAATDRDAAAGATFSLGGQSTLADVLQSNGEALTTGAFNVKSLLGRSAFALPLNQAGGPLAGVTLWGNGAYRNLSGNSATVDWDGDLFGATVGGDAWLTDTLLTGLAVSWADGTFDYTDRSGTDPAPGTYQATLTSLHPYVSTSLLDGQVTLWATGGYGWGEVEITDTADPTAEGTVTADTRLATAAVGGAGRLLNQPGLLTPDGTTTVRVKAEALTTAIKAEQQGDRLAGLTTDARRLRLTLEGSHEQPLPHGAHLTPSVGVGLRHDAGDGRTGTGAEVSGGLRYAHPALRLTLESRGRVLLAHGGDYDDWSVSGRVTLAPGAQGQGLAVTLAPTYQTTTSAGGLAQLWEQGTANRPAPSGPTTPQGLMEATVAYGLPVGDHLLTPYGGMTLGAADARTYRLGSRVSLAHRLNMSLEGARKGATGTIPVDHGVRVQLEWYW